jgi:hypothetical protein
MPTLAEKLSLNPAKNTDVNASEILDEIPEDPAPGQSRRRVVGKPAGRAKAPARKPASLPTKAAVRDELNGYLEMLALGWSMRCETCGDTLDDNAEKIADRLAAIIVRTPRLLELFAGSNTIGEYLLLAQAAFPVVRTAVNHRHHVAPESADAHDTNLAHFQPYRPDTTGAGAMGGAGA